MVFFFHFFSLLLVLLCSKKGIGDGCEEPTHMHIQFKEEVGKAIEQDELEFN
jgi:hypothetical protein